MVYRNPYQGYSDQDYGYTTDDDHMKGHYGRYNGTGQYGQEEYIHQNGYSTQVYQYQDGKQSETLYDQHYFIVAVINIQTPWPCNCSDNELITIKATVEREV